VNESIPRLLWRLLRALWVRFFVEQPECPRCREPLRLTTFPSTKARVWVCDECYNDKGAGIL
jgi:ribosomal protein L37AE/L43A